MQGRGHWEWKSTVQRSVFKLDVLIQVLVNPSQTLSLNRLWIYPSQTLSHNRLWILMLFIMLGLIQITMLIKLNIRSAKDLFR
jgi:hypothetical protein